LFLKGCSDNRCRDLRLQVYKYTVTGVEIYGYRCTNIRLYPQLKVY